MALYRFSTMNSLLLCAASFLAGTPSTVSLVSPCTQDTADALVADLFSPAEVARALSMLRELPSSQALPELLRATTADAFEKEAWAREAVFRALSECGIRDNPPSIENVQHVDILRRGLSEASAAIRFCCCQSAARFADAARSATVPVLIPLLRDKSPEVRAAAARALGAYGAGALDAMPNLLELLVPGDEDRAYWSNVMRDSGSTVLELDARQAAAEARISIGSLDCDVDVYRELDALGQTAAAVAVTREIHRLVDGGFELPPAGISRVFAWLGTLISAGADAKTCRGVVHTIASIATKARNGSPAHAESTRLLSDLHTNTPRWFVAEDREFLELFARRAGR
ncbi:MAG: hypothetical protein HOP15_04270 [Planctomycetes bacterium]|nr:hypothetical protein [Planctomycetota bacterium]